ncbi:MAG TPA: MFS transporter [Bacteroidia bacterium]|nr:MFS transporter [Bacteroidia bacterium]
MKHEATKNPFNIIVIVAALGYFVDIYDLILFSIVRVPSLKALGVSTENLLTEGTKLINAQMWGMLAGGLLWGIMGDKRGRVSVLFGSIILYSVANIFNAYVTSIGMYKWMRFIAGVGLAGELGAGITLVNETMTKEHRGYGTMVVVAFGVLGAVLANIVAKFGWEQAYIIGGIMGLALLVLRIGVYESGLYHSVKESKISRGNFFMLFKNMDRFLRYLSCIALGVPIWYMIGILITFSPEFAKELGIENIQAGSAVMYFYLGTSFGDFMSGYLSQVFKTRKKILLAYLIISVVVIPFYLYSHGISPVMFYIICALLGIASGYWAVFVTIASEQFGTNLRSTVTTTVPNFVRGSLVLLTLLLEVLREKMGFDLVTSALFVGAIALLFAFLSLLGMYETYGKDLNYVED